jgi:hypothetical protein
MSELVQLVPTIRVRDVPLGSLVKMEVGNYEIEIDTKSAEPEITIEYVIDSSRWASVKIVGPDPDVTINEIVREAQALIEKFIRKKASTAESP